jgi:hypothetical protein
MGQSQSAHEQTAEDRSATNQGHAFNHAPAALRIFRFAADSAPRVLELAHVSAFLRECAVEFGSADATLPGAMHHESASGSYYARGRYFRMRAVVERNAARCLWLAAKVLRVYRSGAPMPAVALAPDVTRHDVDWGAEGARRHAELQLTHGGSGLALNQAGRNWHWAQGPVGVTGGKHYFQVSVTDPGYGGVMLGWTISRGGDTDASDKFGAGAAYALHGQLFDCGTAQLDAPANIRTCVIGCLLNLDATPARMTVFVDGRPLAVQCEYNFPKDGRAWYPSAALHASMSSSYRTALHSC